jgi:hypothetical protein
MRIEIGEKSAAKAAAILIALMKKRGGYWIVNAVGDEGYTACKVGTEAGDRMERSGSDCIAGVYCKTIPLAELADDLEAAHLHHVEVYGEREKSGEQITEFVPTSAKVLELLVSGPKLAIDIRRTLGKGKSTVNKALTQLCEEGLVRSEPMPGERTFLYAVAA